MILILLSLLKIKESVKDLHECILRNIKIGGWVKVIGKTREITGRTQAIHNLLKIFMKNTGCYVKESILLDFEKDDLVFFESNVFPDNEFLEDLINNPKMS